MSVTISKEKTAIKSIGAFITGFTAPFKALSFAGERKGYFKFLLIPFLLNCVVWVLLVFLFIKVINPWAMSFLPQGDALIWKIIRFIVSPIVAMLGFMISTFLYSITGNILCAPFNDSLSAKAERDILGEEQWESLPFLKSLLLAIKNVSKQFFFTFLTYILILLLNFIPLIGSILYFIASFLVVNYFFGFEFMLFPLERRSLEYKDISKVTRKYKWFVIGSGFCFSLLSFIPIVGFLVIPLGALGTTIVFDKEILPELTFE